MHMYCKKCGKELEDNVRFCNYCGTEVGSNVVEFKGAFGDKEPENSESSEPQYKYEYVSPEQVSQKAVEEPVEKDVTINIAGHKIKGRLIMKIAAIVAAATSKQDKIRPVRRGKRGGRPSRYIYQKGMIT